MFSDFSIKHASQQIKAEVKRNLSISLGITFSPLILGFVVVVIGGESDFLVAFKKVFLSGEIYFYAISICSTIYTTTQLDNNKGNVGMRMWSGFFVLCCGLFMALYVGQGSSSGQVFHGAASVLFFVLAVVLNYRILVLVNNPPPLPDEVSRERVEEAAAKVDINYE